MSYGITIDDIPWHVSNNKNINWGIQIDNIKTDEPPQQLIEDSNGNLFKLHSNFSYNVKTKAMSGYTRYRIGVKNSNKNFGFGFNDSVGVTSDNLISQIDTVTISNHNVRLVDQGWITPNGYQSYQVQLRVSKLELNLAFEFIEKSELDKLLNFLSEYHSFSIDPSQYRITARDFGSNQITGNYLSSYIVTKLNVKGMELTANINVNKAISIQTKNIRLF